MNLVQESYGYRALSASGQVATGAGVLKGFYVGTSTSLTVKIWDNTAASGAVILETTAPLTAGTFHEVPAGFATGLFVTLGGTGTITVFYA
jgi:hypothetical protein